MSSAIQLTSAMAGIDVAMMSLLKLAKSGVIAPIVALPVSIILYGAEPLIFYSAISLKGMGIINALWDSISTVMIALLGVVIFKEKLSFNQWIGIVFCSIGIILVDGD